MVVTLPTWVLETSLHADPNILTSTRDRITAELARRKSTRAQFEARLSLLVAGASMLISLLAWLFK